MTHSTHDKWDEGTPTPRTESNLRGWDIPGPFAEFTRQLERELAHMAGLLAGQLRYNDEHPSAERAQESDLEVALNIALAALGYFNTEQTDQHWNDQERTLREIQKRMREHASAIHDLKGS